MQRLKNQREADLNQRIKRVTWAGAACLLVLLALFLAVTLRGTGQLAAQVQLISEHPFTVSGHIGDIKTDLALMRIRTERLQSYNQPADVETVRLALVDIHADMLQRIDEIETLYLGPAEDVAALRDSYVQIREAHRGFLQFAALPTSTTTVIAEYEQVHLYPLYDAFSADAQRVLNFARGNLQNIFTSAEALSRSTSLFSCVAVAATALALILFLQIIRRINSSLYQKNRQFVLLSDTIDETFLIFSPGQTRCDFVSGSADRMLGLSFDALRDNWTLLCEHIDEDAAATLRRALHGRNIPDGWDTLIEYQGPQDLQPRWLQLQLYATGENGDAKNILTIADRTEERRASQALQDALTSAQRANSAKKDFLSRMSHEIRTPMNAIIGMTTIAAASIEDRAKVEDCLRKIGLSSKHLLLLLNDILDMSRIESSRMHLHAEPFDLYQFINSFVSVVYPQANEKGLEFEEKISGFSGNTTFRGDPLRLNQILLNLTSNAIKFTPTGGKVSLEVACLPPRNQKCWLRFVVSDTGIGMSEQELERLYTPFEQANPGIANKYGGTGLGMSITQNLVSLMGGYINVKSKPGEGTAFTVELPFARSEVELPAVGAADLKMLDVLVVDDERDICEHAVHLLKRMDIHAEWVLSGMEAVQRAVAAQMQGSGFDVCFIDWKMPEMDGIETTRRIREQIGPDTPIIIITAYDWSDIEAEARAAGVNAFIAKPMFQSSLYNVLVSVTNGAFGMRGAPIAQGKPLAGRRILLAEDNALNQEIAFTLLQMNGATVQCVENGQQALDIFAQAAPGYFDAILMDVQMPVMDGCEATRRLRALDHPDAARVPIVATTANAFSEDVAAVLAAGMDAHIGKPFDIQQLCATLTKLWQQQS